MKRNLFLALLLCPTIVFVQVVVATSNTVAGASSFLERVPLMDDEDGDKSVNRRITRSSSNDIEARRRSALDKNFMRFGRAGDGLLQPTRLEREVTKRNARVGKAISSGASNNLMRFGRANANTNMMRFGRPDPGFSLYNLGGLLSDNDYSNRWIELDDLAMEKRENLMRFGRQSPPQNLMRFGRAHSGGVPTVVTWNGGDDDNTEFDDSRE